MKVEIHDVEFDGEGAEPGIAYVQGYYVFRSPSARKIQLLVTTSRRAKVFGRLRHDDGALTNEVVTVTTGGLPATVSFHPLEPFTGAVWIAAHPLST